MTLLNSPLALLYVPCVSPIASCMLDLLIPSVTVPPGLIVQRYCVLADHLSSSEHVLQSNQEQFLGVGSGPWDVSAAA